jgi:hypothetical protein
MLLTPISYRKRLDLLFNPCLSSIATASLATSENGSTYCEEFRRCLQESEAHRNRPTSSPFQDAKLRTASTDNRRSPRGPTTRTSARHEAPRAVTASSLRLFRCHAARKVAQSTQHLRGEIKVPCTEGETGAFRVCKYEPMRNRQTDHHCL